MMEFRRLTLVFIVSVDQGLTMTFVSVVTGVVVSITLTVGLALMTLTSFTTASSSTTVLTPIVLDTKSIARSLSVYETRSFSQCGICSPRNARRSHKGYRQQFVCRTLCNFFNCNDLCLMNVVVQDEGVTA